MVRDIIIPPDMLDMPVWGTAQLRRIIPYSGTHIVKLAKDGKFPRPFTIGGKNFWRPAAVTDFLAEAMAKSDRTAA